MVFVSEIKKRKIEKTPKFYIANFDVSRVFAIFKIADHGEDLGARC